MNEKNFKNWIKTTQIESLRTNNDETINLKVNFDRNWKNW